MKTFVRLIHNRYGEALSCFFVGKSIPTNQRRKVSSMTELLGGRRMSVVMWISSVLNCLTILLSIVLVIMSVRLVREIRKEKK